MREAATALDTSVREGSGRCSRRAQGTPGSYPVISLWQYMATATARREEGAKAKGKVITEGGEAATAPLKGKSLTEDRRRKKREHRQK